MEQQQPIKPIPPKQQPDQQHHHHHHNQQQQQQQKPQHNHHQPKQQSGKEEDREHRQSSGTSDGTVIAATNTGKGASTVATAAAAVSVPKSYAYACQKKMNHYYHLRPLNQYRVIGRFLADYRRVARNLASSANTIANSSAPNSPKSLRRNKLDRENHNADPLHSD